MPTDPGRCRECGHDLRADNDHADWCKRPSAPSVRRAQIPDTAWSAAAQALYDHEWDESEERCACGLITDAEHTDHQADVALAAAAPVLLSEYQQRIEAVRRERDDAEKMLVAAITVCGGSLTFPRDVLVGIDFDGLFIKVEEDRVTDALTYRVTGRAALGSTKTAWRES